MPRRNLTRLLAFALICTPSALLAQSAGDPIGRAIAAPTRPAADVARDEARKPAQLLAFAGVKPGDSIADLMPGQGYFTRLFSVAVGDRGHVYAVVPAELAQVMPKALAVMTTLAGEPGMGNVAVLSMPTAAIAAPVPLDIAWTDDNYHDIYAFFGADKAAQFDAAVYKALKPGGVFIVIDHVAPAGTDSAAVKHLHRIDPAVVKAQLLAAGFVLEAQSTVLANPADSHTDPVFAPSIRGHTDQFVMRFRKPG
jgi:predicted methyltransferase